MSRSIHRGHDSEKHRQLPARLSVAICAGLLVAATVAWAAPARLQDGQEDRHTSVPPEALDPPTTPVQPDTKPAPVQPDTKPNTPASTGINEHPAVKPEVPPAPAPVLSPPAPPADSEVGVGLRTAALLQLGGAILTVALILAGAKWLMYSWRKKNDPVSHPVGTEVATGEVLAPRLEGLQLSIQQVNTKLDGITASAAVAPTKTPSRPKGEAEAIAKGAALLRVLLPTFPQECRDQLKAPLDTIQRLLVEVYEWRTITSEGEARPIPFRGASPVLPGPQPVWKAPDSKTIVPSLRLEPTDNRILLAARQHPLVQKLMTDNRVEVPGADETVSRERLEQMLFSVAAILEDRLAVETGEKSLEYGRRVKDWRSWLVENASVIWKKMPFKLPRERIDIDPALASGSAPMIDELPPLEGDSSGLRLPALRICRVPPPPFESWWKKEGRDDLILTLPGNVVGQIESLQAMVRSRWIASYGSGCADGPGERRACCETWVLALREALASQGRELAACGCLTAERLSEWDSIRQHLASLAGDAGLEAVNSTSSSWVDPRTVDWWVPRGRGLEDEGLVPTLRRTRDGQVLVGESLLAREASGWREPLLSILWEKGSASQQPLAGGQKNVETIKAAWGAMSDWERAARPTPERSTRVIRSFWLPLWDMSWRLPEAAGEDMRARLAVAIANLGLRCVDPGEGFDQHFVEPPAGSSALRRPALLRREDSGLVEPGVSRRGRVQPPTRTDMTAPAPTAAAPGTEPSAATAMSAVSNADAQRLLLDPIQMLSHRVDGKKLVGLRESALAIASDWSRADNDGMRDAVQARAPNEYFKPLFQIAADVYGTPIRERQEGSTLMSHVAAALEVLGLMMHEDPTRQPSSFMKPPPDEPECRPALQTKNGATVLLRGTTRR